MADFLNDELEQLAQSEDSKVEETVQDATLLLEAPKQDMEIFESLGMRHQLEKAQKIKNEVDRKNVYKTWSDKVRSGAQIKELCNTYDLKMLPAMYYKGNLSMEMAEEIKKFTEKHNLMVTTVNFFILSTRESFYDHDGARKDNCILFFREGERDSDGAREKDYFAQIYNWGEPVTAARRNRFLFFGHVDGDKASSAVATVFSVILFLLSLVVGYLWLSVTIAAIAALIIFINCTNEKYYDRSWNSIERN